MAQPVFDRGLSHRLAVYELSALAFANVLPVERFQASRAFRRPTSIFDINGDVLFHRYPVMKGSNRIAYADITASPAFSQPLLSVSFGMDWDEKSFIEQAINAAEKNHPRLQFDRTRFVAYSYPKVAVQFLAGGREVLMLELGTWKAVPAQRRGSLEEPPGNFERWSLLDSIPTAQQEEHLGLLRQRATAWDEAVARQAAETGYKTASIDLKAFETAFKPIIPIINITSQLHYSLNQSDHTCYELRGQITSEWCVAASVEMLLDFYRYDYTQERFAADLGLGTVNNPQGLPYSQDYTVVTELQNLTSNALIAYMDPNPNWDEFVNEIDGNRPLISFIPGHSRTVAGYTETRLFPWHVFSGLLVYDPWPPNMGVITQWENFATQSYRRTFTAHLTLV